MLNTNIVNIELNDKLKINISIAEENANKLNLNDYIDLSKRIKRVNLIESFDYGTIWMVFILISVLVIFLKKLDIIPSITKIIFIKMIIYFPYLVLILALIISFTQVDYYNCYYINETTSNYINKYNGYMIFQTLYLIGFILGIVHLIVYEKQDITSFKFTDHWIFLLFFSIYAYLCFTGNIYYYSLRSSAEKEYKQGLIYKYKVVMSEYIEDKLIKHKKIEVYHVSSDKPIKIIK